MFLKEYVNLNGIFVRKDGPVHKHCRGVEQFLPFIGVGTSHDLFRPNNDPTNIINFLSDDLSHDLSIGFSDKEKAMWVMIFEVLKKVERFKGDKNLDGAGGNVFEHTLFSCILAYSFFSDVMEKSYFSEQQRNKIKESFSNVIRDILSHDVGEWVGEFGTLNQQNQGATAKDCSLESNFTQYIFKLAIHYSSLGQEGKDEFKKITSHFQQRGIAAIDKANAEYKGNGQGRDAFLTGIFLEIDSELKELCAKIPEINGDGKELYQKSIAAFNSAEEYLDFEGTFSRLVEKLEGSLHFLVLLNQGKNITVIGGNHVDLSVEGSSRYHEKLIPVMYSQVKEISATEANVPRVPIHFLYSLAESIKSETYSFMANYSLATINSRCQTVKRSKYEAIELSLAYLSAASGSFMPSTKSPCIASCDDLAELKPQKADKIIFERELVARGINLGRVVS